MRDGFQDHHVLVAHALQHLDVVVLAGHAQPVLAEGLCLVQHAVREQVEVLGVLGMVREDGQPDGDGLAHHARRWAASCENSRTFSRIRRATMYAWPSSQTGRIAMNWSPAYRAAMSPARTAVFRTAAKSFRSAVADVVSVEVVDGLEIVEVDDQERETVVLAFRPFGLVVQQVPEGDLVVEVGERVAGGETFDLAGIGGQRLCGAALLGEGGEQALDGQPVLGAAAVRSPRPMPTRPQVLGVSRLKDRDRRSRPASYSGHRPVGSARDMDDRVIPEGSEQPVLQDRLPDQLLPASPGAALRAVLHQKI